MFAILHYSPVSGIVLSAGQGNKSNRNQMNLKELIRIKMNISFFSHMKMAISSINITLRKTKPISCLFTPIT